MMDGLCEVPSKYENHRLSANWLLALWDPIDFHGQTVLRRAHPSCRIEMRGLFSCLNCCLVCTLNVFRQQNIFEKSKVKIYRSEVGEISKFSDFEIKIRF